MNISPSHISIGRIFERNLLFEVPKYQRYYAWEEEQVKDFIQDIDSILQNIISETPIEHFFGGIVCASKTVAGSTRQQKELIDGQQRITTALLLVVNIINKYRCLLEEDELSEEDKSTIESRIRKLNDKYILYHDEINRRPQTVHKLVLSLPDKHYFEEILNNGNASIERDSHRKLNRANLLLKDFIKEKTESCAGASEAMDVLYNLELVLNEKCTVIFMDCDSRASAYKLFQVLNDRGAGLNEGDLLKSKTLEALEAYPAEQESAQLYWDEILEEDPSKVDGFLRTYFASHKGKRAGRTSLYDNFLEGFFEDLFHGELPDSQAKAQKLKEQIENILIEIRLYRKIVNGIWPYPESQPVTAWDRNRLHVLVKFLSYDITLPLLLAATKLDHRKFAILVHTLEKFMFRYKTICGNAHQVLSELYNAEAVKIRSNPDTHSFSTLFGELRRYIIEKANDEVFAVQLKTLKYQKNGGNKSLRYFFSTLCDYDRWRQEGMNGYPTAFKESIINYDAVTIEHIDSQNPEHGNILPETDIHRICNLTILAQGDNSQRVNNKPFSEKKCIYQTSQYGINQELSTYSTWDTASAESWQQFIIDFACKVIVV